MLAGRRLVERDAPVVECLRQPAARLQGEAKAAVVAAALIRFVRIVEHGVADEVLAVEVQPAIELHAAEHPPSRAVEALSGPGFEAIEAIEAEAALTAELHAHARHLQQLVAAGVASRPPCVNENGASFSSQLLVFGG